MGMLGLKPIRVAPLVKGSPLAQKNHDCERLEMPARTKNADQRLEELDLAWTDLDMTKRR